MSTPEPTAEVSHVPLMHPKTILSYKPCPLCTIPHIPIFADPPQPEPQP